LVPIESSYTISY